MQQYLALVGPIEYKFSTNFMQHILKNIKIYTNIYAVAILAQAFGYALCQCLLALCLSHLVLLTPTLSGFIDHHTWSGYAVTSALQRDGSPITQAPLSEATYSTIHGCRS